MSSKHLAELYVVKSESFIANSIANDILGKCGDKISERYDKFIEDIGFYRDYMKNIKSINSNFTINSDEYVIKISS